MAKPKREPPRGIVQPGGDPHGRHARYLVDPPLDDHLEHWWSVSWSLPKGASVVRETLPHPCFHVVVEAGVARVVGVPKGRFVRTLEGTGRVFGAKFLPGAFRPLLDAPAHTFTGKTVLLASVVGKALSDDYAQNIEAEERDEARVAVAARFFQRILPPPPPYARELRALFHAALNDRAITTADALAARSGRHLRDLQRLFRDTVGVSPKWVIQRYRLHEALLALEAGQSTVTDLAALLGYADQAHFCRDFKRLAGLPPSHYARRAAKR